MASVARTVTSLGGIASIEQLRAKGIPPAFVRYAFAQGDVIRVRRGWYATQRTDPDRIRAARVGGVAACLTACAIHGLWQPEGTTLHVSIADKSRHQKDPDLGVPITRSSDSVTLHWDVDDANHGSVVSVEDALEQVFRCQPDEIAFALLESALRRGALSHAGLARLRARLPAHRRIFALARSNADSGTESLFRFRMSKLGIQMRSQVPIDGVGTVDFVIGDRLVVEIDSFAHHSGDDKRRRDLVRDAILAGLGYTDLRFDYAMVMGDWDLVASTVFAVVARGDHLAT